MNQIDAAYAAAIETDIASRCAACSGCGEVYNRNGGWKCEACHGTGLAPTPPATSVELERVAA